MGIVHGSRALTLVGVGVAVALAGGGGWAIAATSGGVLHACANKRTGALRLSADCKRPVERGVSWNVKGRPGLTGGTGPSGPTGPAGVTGATGPIGPSTVYSGSLAGPVTITTATSPGDKVGHLNLPAGSWVIFAKAWLENQDGVTATTAGCELDVGSASDQDWLKLEPIGTNAFRGAVALNVAVTLPSAGLAQLSCFTGSGVTITANNAVVTAIQVSSLNANALIAG